MVINLQLSKNAGISPLVEQLLSALLSGVN
jgi:hypothetical protein